MNTTFSLTEMDVYATKSISNIQFPNATSSLVEVHSPRFIVNSISGSAVQPVVKPVRKFLGTTGESILGTRKSKVIPQPKLDWTVSSAFGDDWLRKLPLKTQFSRVIPLSDVEPWLLVVWKAIAKLKELPDNWDGYGSPAIQSAALTAGFRLVLAIKTEKQPIPHVSPVPGGGIQLEWQTPNRELELEILPNGSVEYLTVTKDDQMEDGCLSVDQTDKVQGLIRWLIDK